MWWIILVAAAVAIEAALLASQIVDAIDRLMAAIEDQERPGWRDYERATIHQRIADRMSAGDR